MARKKETPPFTVNGYFQVYQEREDKNAPTYWERIAPTVITADEYFATVESKREWLIKRIKNVAKYVYGVNVTIKQEAE